MNVSLTLSEKYCEYVNVFSVKNINLLFTHKISDHVIDLNSKNSLYELLYNLFNTELKVLRTYLNNALMKEWIYHSVSFTETLILFIFKKNEGLQLCIDYRDLNQMIIKNRHSLLLISETLNWLSETQLFMKLNLKDTYHHIQIKESDEWKTAFHT